MNTSKVSVIGEVKKQIATGETRLNFHLRTYLILWLCSMIWQSSIAQNYDSVKIKIMKITESVYMLEGRGGNIGVCIGNDGTFVIDDQFAPLTSRIKAAIAQLTHKPVQFIINTHWHGDHTGGNENFGGEGAIIVSHENSRKRLETDQFYGLPAHTLAATHAAGLPKITFTESVTFHYNSETIDVFHKGAAHSDGDAVIYFRQSNVIHMGDVFVRYEFPFIDERNGGNVSGMIETIDYVIGEINNDTKIIPGHGQLSSKQDMIEYNMRLKTIRDRVKKFADEGKSFEDIIKSDFLSGYGKRGANEIDFIKSVYNNVLKMKK